MPNYRARTQSRRQAFGANQTALGTGACQQSPSWNGKGNQMIFFFGISGNTRPKAQAEEAVQQCPAKPQRSGLSGLLDGLGSDATGLEGES